MRNIKTFKDVVLAVLTATVLSSCESILNEQPYSQLSENQFWKTPTDVAAGVAAIYDGMQKTYDNKYYRWGEFRSDNFVRNPTTATAEMLELLTNTITPTNTSTLRWDEFYLMIARANLAIENIPKIAGYDRQLLGEAHAIRAFAYFHAVRVWGDVPLFTEALKGFDQEIQRPRTKASEIMEKVILPDIQKAESLISQNTNQFRFSKAALWSLQGEVYMYLKDYAKAKVALTNIVRLNTFSLVNTRDTWQRLFLNDILLGGKIMTGPELIFSIRYDLTDTDRSGVQGIFFSGIPDAYISPRLENKWIGRFPIDSISWYRLYPNFAPRTKDAAGRTLFGDWRYFESRESGVGIGLSRVAKYRKANANIADDTDVHVYRYANTILLLAEAENQLGNKDAAIALLNQLRTARQLPTVRAVDFTTKEQLEDYLLDERQFELLGEGVRWWDLIRTNKAVQVMNPINGQTERKLLFPIFERHLIDNPMLTQTEGY
jgi:tetratricopeptide (TPR) repeat protein